MTFCLPADFCKYIYLAVDGPANNAKCGKTQRARAGFEPQVPGLQGMRTNLLAKRLGCMTNQNIAAGLPTATNTWTAAAYKASREEKKKKTSENGQIMRQKGEISGDKTQNWLVLVWSRMFNRMDSMNSVWVRVHLLLCASRWQSRRLMRFFFPSLGQKEPSTWLPLPLEVPISNP